MDWMLVATLLLKYGEPFVEQLIENINNKTPVTPEEYAKLKEKLQITGDELIPLKVSVPFTPPKKAQ